VTATALIIAAAGRGRRFGGHIKKPYAELAGRPILLRTLDRFAPLEAITCRILVVAPDDLEFVRCNFLSDLRQLRVDQIVPGGQERYDSVSNALKHVPDDCPLVAVHDAVRPLVPLKAILEALRAAEQIGAACVGVPCQDTVKRTGEGDIVEETLSRHRLWLVQTPQVFRTALLKLAYGRLHTFPGAATDDAQLVEALGHPVAMVEGGRENIKITTAADLELAEAWLRATGRA
jgi:2-C-methyl-D-erythritol 4-phosphate cytidylyltransferase